MHYGIQSSYLYYSLSNHERQHIYTRQFLFHQFLYTTNAQRIAAVIPYTNRIKKNVFQFCLPFSYTTLQFVHFLNSFIINISKA